MDVKDRLWNGAINTNIVLEAANGAEYLLPVFRNSYLPLHYPAIVNFFDHYTTVDLHETPIWLEYEGVPLKWNLPFGVLYDLLFLPANPTHLAWVLTLRYETEDTPYPSKEIIPFGIEEGHIDYEGMLSQVVVNQLKQSCYVMNGNSKAMMSLSEEHSRALWKAICLHDYTVFHDVTRRLQRNALQRVPVKIYLAGSTIMVQAPIKPAEDGEPTTLRSVLRKWMPDYFGDSQLAVAYCQGIKMDVLSDVPLFEVWSAFRHLDNFMYIVVMPE